MGDRQHRADVSDSPPFIDNLCPLPYLFLPYFSSSPRLLARINLLAPSLERHKSRHLCHSEPSLRAGDLGPRLLYIGLHVAWRLQCGKNDLTRGGISSQDAARPILARR